jgi:phospholipase C
MGGYRFPIEHVVVLMLENRSYDHYLGCLPHGQPLTGAEYNLVDPSDPTSKKVYVSNRSGYITAVNPSHDFRMAGNLCDHWHASVPGPTWPNRFFAHAATSDAVVADEATHLYEAKKTAHAAPFHASGGTRGPRQQAQRKGTAGRTRMCRTGVE